MRSIKVSDQMVERPATSSARCIVAEAAAAERTFAADAAAYEIEVESKARAAAVKREAEAREGNPRPLQLRAAEKWDGTLLRFSGGDSISLINIDSLDKPSR